VFLELYCEKKENILINIISQDFTIYHRSTCVFNNSIYFFRFLSTGISFRSLSSSARLAHSTIAETVYETCDAIWNRLVKRHMPFVTENMLQEIVDEFETQWNFLNCVGAIDGKHVRIRCPQSSGSQFYNYKSYFSVHLQAIVDAKYKFMTVDIGAYGRQSDSGVFSESSVFRHLEVGSFNLPPPRQIPRTNITLSYVLVGDQGYPLKEYRMRPNPTDNGSVSLQKEIFNYRLSTARRTVQSAFGILVAKWRCLKTKLQVNPQHVDTIRTVCLLHNIIIDNEGFNENSCNDANNT